MTDAADDQAIRRSIRALCRAIPCTGSGDYTPRGRQIICRDLTKCDCAKAVKNVAKSLGIPANA